jgi:hypothetical protein
MLYHNFGSKQLIETLYSHGCCASYGEVRRYLTSIVHHEMEKRHDDVHVPDGIIPSSQHIILVRDKGIRSIEIAIDTSLAVGYSSVEMFIFSMSRLRMRTEECNICSFL